MIFRYFNMCYFQKLGLSFFKFSTKSINALLESVIISCVGFLISKYMGYQKVGKV